ncbi:MAG: GIDE domain-containing protein [Candidatus Sulfotelmatobacter sp.]
MIASKLILSALLIRSQDIRPIVWCVIGLCAGIYIFFNGFRILQRRKLILNTPVSKIRSASMGMVELSGLAVGPYTLLAPITQRPSYYYRTILWEWKRRGRSRQWVKVAAECMHVPFFLDDNTGKVMVDPRSAELDLHRDFQQEFCDSFFTFKQEAPPNVHSFLSRHGIMTNNKIKVEEFCIKPKNSLFLLGTLDENPGLELTPQPIPDEEHHTLTFDKALWFNPAHSELGRTALSFVTGGGNTHADSSVAASAQVVRLTPEAPTKLADMSQQQKIAAALQKAGVVNPAAWATTGVTSSMTAASPDPSSSPSGGAPKSDAFDPHPPIVLMKGKNNPTFLISWRSQREIARSLGWKCTLMIWGGPALTLLCLYLLLALTNSL